MVLTGVSSTMPQNITLDDVDALDDVNGSSPYLNDVTERIDIAYDDGGDRLWYSYNKLADGSGMTRVTLPGVGVYEATKTNGVNGVFKLVRKDLVAGGYRDEAGNAHFPVMDAQGNVRGYATSDGMQSAYDYYAYGTMMDLSPDAGDDNKRWQDKEFDGEHGKYYFGARYFDPFFGMWMSPDPAGQFANPYTYGGDPVNFVDPNGEFAFAPVLIGAAIGALVSGVIAYANCSGKDGCVGESFKMALVGGAAGAAGTWATGAVSGLSASAVGATGVSTHSGVLAAYAGGAVEGVASGFASSAVTYSLGNHSWNFGEFLGSTFSGAAIGLFMGGTFSLVGYGLSDEYKWNVYKDVYNYGKAHNKELDIAKYIANQEGMNPSRIALTNQKYVVEKTAVGPDRLAEGVRTNNGVTIARSGRNSAENFYETVAHEAWHEKFAALSEEKRQSLFQTYSKEKLSVDAEEALVRDKLLSHPFSNEKWGWGKPDYWTKKSLRDIQIQHIKKFLEGPEAKYVKQTLDMYGKNQKLYY